MARLQDQYCVEIYREGMTDDQAQEIESELISQLGEHPVNWVNPRRAFDYDARERP